MSARFFTHQPLRMRGGGAHLSVPEKGPIQAFYDVDGTLYDGTMAHTSWWFLLALPNKTQRVSKAIQISFVLPLVGVIAIFDEGEAAKILAAVLFRGVKVEDAIQASKSVTDGILSVAYKEVFEHLIAGRERGRRTGLLTGNAAPMLQDLASRLRCDLIGMEMAAEGGVYTGHVRGSTCVGEAKRRKLLLALNLADPDLNLADSDADLNLAEADCVNLTDPDYVKSTPDARAKSTDSGHTRAKSTEAQREMPKSTVLANTIGVGNSKYDIPFLSLMASAFLVRPSRRSASIYGACAPVYGADAPIYATNP